MKNILKSLTLVAAGSALGFVMLVAALVVTGARPWHSRQNPDVAFAAGPTQAVPLGSEVQAETMHEGMMKGGMPMGQGMTSGGMAMCQQMMSEGMVCPHQEMKSLVAKAAISFGAIEKEQNPTLLKTRLAELGTLLKQLQAKSEEKCPMMEQMQGQMQGKMQTQGGMGGAHSMVGSPESK